MMVDGPKTIQLIPTIMGPRFLFSPPDAGGGPLLAIRTGWKGYATFHERRCCSMSNFQAPKGREGSPVPLGFPERHDVRGGCMKDEVSRNADDVSEDNMNGGSVSPNPSAAATVIIFLDLASPLVLSTKSKAMERRIDT